MSKASIQKEVGVGVSETAEQFMQYKSDVLEAMEEVKRITHDSNEKRYNSFQEVVNDIDQ